MPIIGRDAQERGERRIGRAVQRSGRGRGFGGTVSELSGSPGPAPYQTNEWDGLSKSPGPAPYKTNQWDGTVGSLGKGGGARLTSEQREERAEAIKVIRAERAAKLKAARDAKARAAEESATVLVDATPTAESWQERLDGWFANLKAKLGIE